MIVIYYNKQ